MHTSIHAVKNHLPTTTWERLCDRLNNKSRSDKPVSILDVLEIAGHDHAVTALRAVPSYDREKRLFAVRCARQLSSFMQDPRSIQAVEVAERYANNQATQMDLVLAYADATAAAEQIDRRPQSTQSERLASRVASATCTKCAADAAVWSAVREGMDTDDQSLYLREMCEEIYA